MWQTQTFSGAFGESRNYYDAVLCPMLSCQVLHWQNSSKNVRQSLGQPREGLCVSEQVDPDAIP